MFKAGSVPPSAHSAGQADLAGAVALASHPSWRLSPAYGELELFIIYLFICSSGFSRPWVVCSPLASVRCTVDYVHMIA